MSDTFCILSETFSTFTDIIRTLSDTFGILSDTFSILSDTFGTTLSVPPLPRAVLSEVRFLRLCCLPPFPDAAREVWVCFLSADGKDEPEPLAVFLLLLTPPARSRDCDTRLLLGLRAVSLPSKTSSTSESTADWLLWSIARTHKKYLKIARTHKKYLKTYQMYLTYECSRQRERERDGEGQRDRLNVSERIRNVSDI